MQSEQELGVDLLCRTTHEFELTEAGQYLLERGPALLSTSDELWRSVRSFGSGERGFLIIAYGPSVSYETAPKLLTALAARHPEVVISTDVRPTREILAAVNDGAIDAGSCVVPPRTTELETFAFAAELGWLTRHANLT
jgi:DNA-binding transcriptional LysR family regulator